MKKFIVLLALVGIVMGCDNDNDSEVKPTTVKLDYYEEMFDIPDLDFQPQLRTTYDYNFAGMLEGYTFYGYDPDTNTMLEQRHFEFSYADGNVDKIEGFLVNNTAPYISYTYQYDGNSVVSRIIENNYAAGVNSEATFSYPEANVVHVAYQYSNGGSFQYEMTFEGDNVRNDKTTRGAQLCSDGKYTYDQHPNPFRTLGYTDYTLINVSTNNKLTEDVNYVACAFPNLKAESYEYIYNSDGYPIEVVTKYKPHDGITPKSTKKFYYKLM